MPCADQDVAAGACPDELGDAGIGACGERPTDSAVAAFTVHIACSQGWIHGRQDHGALTCDLPAGADQPGLVGVDDRLEPVTEAELGEHVGDVRFDGGFGEE